MHRMPIFHDDRSFRDQTERMFREMQDKMSMSSTDSSFPGFMSPGWTSSSSAGGWPTANQTVAGINGESTQRFFELWPLGQQTQAVQDANRTAQSEILDDATARSLFVDLDPQQGSQGRVFRMSFDVRQYDPAEVAVRSEDKCLVVEAKHSEDKNGAKVARQFCRRIQLPADVDPAKLSSTLSTDGILTVQAPVPPRYQAVTAGPADSHLSATYSQQQQQQQPRISPLTIQMDSGSTARSRSPLLGVVPSTHSSSQYVTSQRISPVPFSSQLQPVGFQPVTVLSGGVPVVIAPRPLSVDTPVVSVDPVTGRRRVDLLLELGRPFTAEDVVVKVDGRRLTIEAKHENKDQGRVSTSSTQKQFELSEDVEPSSVKAMMRDDGKLSVTALVKQ